MSEERSIEARPARWRSLLVGADASDHADLAIGSGAQLASLLGAKLTACHVYAARLHDQRFRQMEGGLPESYRQEEKLEEQREIHDELIGRGLGVISDAYLDRAAAIAASHQVTIQRQALEGKNYRRLLDEAASGHDLLLLGALGLGAVDSMRLGSVTRRAARHATIDTLVVRQQLPGNGPLAVALDGSAKAYGALSRAIDLAQLFGQPIQLLAAFDPDYHYTAFHRIAGLLSEEAGKVFRFREQERLHEEIIDSGLAQIYRGYLEVAADIASSAGVESESHLLAGKPLQVLAEKVAELKPSLLLVGRTGLHADQGLDIGSVSESLLERCDCSLLLGSSEWQPPVETVAEVTTRWSEEAEERLGRVPAFARPMARMAILNHARQQGHTVITARMVEEVGRVMMPQLKSDQMRTSSPPAADQKFEWQAAALARLARVPAGAMRDRARSESERLATSLGEQKVTLACTEEAISALRSSMAGMATANGAPDQAGPPAPSSIQLTTAAQERLAAIPHQSSREMTARALQQLAASAGVVQIDLAFVEQVLATFSRGSAGRSFEMEWEQEAEEAIARAPAMVRGMLIAEIEGWARREGLERIGVEAVERVKSHWLESGHFHLDPADPRSGQEPV
jgi:nucleotide-binding universal stress UspA family protein